MIPDSFKQDLLNRVDLVELVSGYVQVKKAGANYLGLCPFHNEKTPSFTVSPAKQFYHCFGCGAHGNAIGFLMAYANLGYVDALKDLAASAGMQLPESAPRTPADAARSERAMDMSAVMETAMAYYRAQLKNSPRAIEYLKRRGLSGEIAARFRIGYAPDEWQGLRTAFERYDAQALVDCGLVIASEGRRYDRFRDRIMFPIANARGAVIGFGGRVLGAAEPKYVNSPETQLFEKGREVYGLPQAREAIQRARRVVVVEGYMDVVALAQHGVDYAVATLGTATTAAQVSKLLRLADELVFCFDGDAAGRKAAWRALDIALPLTLDRQPIRFLFLPDGHDPDSFVRARGAEAFEQQLRAATPLSGFLLGELRAGCELGAPEGRSAFLAAAKPYLHKLTAPGLKLQLLKEVAALAQLTTDEAERLLELRPQNAFRRPSPAKMRFQAPSSLEWKLLGCAVVQPELAKELDISILNPQLPETDALIELSRWSLLHPGGNGLDALLIEHFKDRPQAELLFNAQAAAGDTKLPLDEVSAQFANIVQDLKLLRRREALHQMQDLLAQGRLSKEEFARYGRELLELKNLELARRSQH